MQKVHVIRLIAPIGDHCPSIAMTEVRAALAPDEPVDDGLLIDLHALHLQDGDDEFWQRGQSKIEEQIRGFIEHRVMPSSTNALAVFAIAPIPMLSALGRALGDKHPTRIFERHRHTDSWKWDETGELLHWQTRFVGAAEQVRDVAVLLSISGKVQELAVRESMHGHYHWYEISLAEPRPNAVRTVQDLAGFAKVWRELLTEISRRFGPHVHVHLFPAAPVSVSVECGRRLLPKADPPITVYDYRNGVFVRTLGLEPPDERPGLNGAILRVPTVAVDVVVLVALEEEFRELDAVLGNLQGEKNPQHGGYDYKFELNVRGAKQLRCIARMIGGMGPAAAQLEAERAIERHQPRVVVMLGIAAGLHHDLKIGDVFVADQVDAYDATQKAVPKGRGSGWEIEKRGQVFQSDHALMLEVANFSLIHKADHEKWQVAGKEDLEKHISGDIRTRLIDLKLIRSRPEVQRGHLASGATVGAAKAFKVWLKQRDASIKALEMEAAGVARSAALRVSPIKTMVIRGISDAGDEGKSALDAVGEGVLRAIAMRNATRFFRALAEVSTF